MQDYNTRLASKNIEDKLKAAQDPECPAEILDAILMDEDIWDGFVGQDQDVNHLKLSNAIASHPNCPSGRLMDLMIWDYEQILLILGNPNCPVSVLYDVIKEDNIELKEAAAKSPAVKKLKPAGFGRFADPETGEIVAKMQDGKLVPVS